MKRISVFIFLGLLLLPFGNLKGEDKDGLKIDNPVIIDQERFLDVHQPVQRHQIMRKGFNVVCWNRGCYEEANLLASLMKLKKMGVNWIAVIPKWYQKLIKFDGIAPHPEDSPSRGEIESLIFLAKKMGFKVLLKPHISIIGSGSRTSILPSMAERGRWWADYQNYIVTYAELAARMNVDMYAIGTELKRMTGVENRASWLSLISEVRRRYTGPLTYAANWDEYNNVSFWDQLNFIGIDAYFPIAEGSDETLEQLIEGVRGVRAFQNDDSPEDDFHGFQRSVCRFAEEKNRAVIYTELGYEAKDGTTMRPWDYGREAGPDAGEQELGYKAVLTVLQDPVCEQGVFWWFWPADLTEDNPYIPYRRPAGNVVREFWGSGRLPR